MKKYKLQNVFAEISLVMHVHFSMREEVMLTEFVCLHFRVFLNEKYWSTCAVAIGPTVYNLRVRSNLGPPGVYLLLCGFIILAFDQTTSETR